MSNAQFKRNFAKLLKRAGDRANLVPRWAAAEMLKRVIEKSPVGDPSMWANPEMAPEGYVGGRFKANWNVQARNIDYGTDAPVDDSGAGAIARGQGPIATFPIGTTLYITNSMPYSRRLEFDGWSRQAPGGMVRLTVREFKQIIKQAAAAIP